MPCWVGIRTDGRCVTKRHTQPISPPPAVEDFTLLVDGTPKVHAPAGDPHDHLVEVPSVARPRPQASREERAEFEHPTADRFIGQVEPAFGKQFLDVAVAQGEADIELNCVLDGGRREAVAAV
jgi:hypothetical protein